MPFITAKDGAQLYWHAWGEGAPVLFLNSLGCGSRMWDYQMAALADEGSRCIGFDRRGHGRSDHPDRGPHRRNRLSGLTLIAHSIAGGEAAL